MTDKDVNTTEFAFPSRDWNGEWRGPSANHGMTLRDYFAAKAPMDKVNFDSPNLAAEFAGLDSVPHDMDGMARMSATIQAKLAYMWADALLAERDK